MKKVIVLLLSIAVILSSLTVCFAVSTPDSPITQDYSAEDENLSDYRLVIGIEKDYNVTDYTLVMFAKYGVVTIEYDKGLNFLILTLDQHDRQNLLDVIYQIEADAIPGIWVIAPDGFSKMMDETTPKQTEIETTGVITETTESLSKEKTRKTQTSISASNKKSTSDSSSNPGTKSVVIAGSENGAIETGDSMNFAIILTLLLMTVLTGYWLRRRT